ncbi:MAG: LysE family translocator [Burkholderiales bacterium]|jgi:threonine/homoserine/homoserine lactone efflux protein|nr:LysE family translocator [Burkholderiales bacterium]
MPGLETLLLFLGAAILITLAPGPDNLMVISLGMARGRNAGIAFGVGCGFGCLSHTLLATLGVSAAIAASPSAFTALRIAGGLYLIWIGWQSLKPLFSKPSVETVDTGNRSLPSAFQQAGLPALFTRGLIANAINPKVIVFFLAFLPQFVDPARSHPALQLAVFGVIFTIQAALIFSVIGALAGALGERLARNHKIGLYLDRIAGLIFIGLGLRLLWL